MSDTFVEETPEVITEEPVTGLPASSSVDDRSLDDLLADYDAAVNKQTELPASDTPVQQDAPIDGSAELDQLLAELSGPSADTQRADALQGQLSELQAQVRREQDWREYESFANDLQKQATELSPHIDENFVRLRLESAAHNKDIALAFDTRHIDPKAAAIDLAYVQHALNQLQGNPNADPKQVQELNKLAYQLNVATNSASIIRRLKNTILTEAKNLKPPYDPDLSADHFAVAQAVKEGAGPIDLPEAPVRWGSLSAKEGRERVLRDFGFDPGWSH